jgi:hypothetical protein
MSAYRFHWTFDLETTRELSAEALNELHTALAGAVERELAEQLASGRVELRGLVANEDVPLDWQNNEVEDLDELFREN